MDTALGLTNASYFNRRERVGGFQEVWYLKLNNPKAAQALWLRFTVLMRGNKSKEIAEVWAIFFESTGGATRKVGVKNSWPLTEFENVGADGLRIAENCLLDGRAQRYRAE